PFDENEVPLFMQAVLRSRISARFYAMFAAFLGTGARQSEIAGMEITDYDRRGRFIEIRQSIRRHSRKVARTKTKTSTRRIAIRADLCAILDRHIAEQKEYWLKRGMPQPKWMFPNEDGNPINFSTFAERHFWPVLKAAGLHQRGLHNLRHTYASLLLRAG